MKSARLVYCFVQMGIAVLGAACTTEEEYIEPTHSFTRLYETQQFGDHYRPVSLVQTSDSGYLTLSRTDQWKAHLFKSDFHGKTQWVTTLSEPFVSPIPKLFFSASESKFLVFSMNELTQGLESHTIDVVTGDLEIFKSVHSVKYPLAIHQTADQGWIILGYDREAQSSTLHYLDHDFNKLWDKSFEVHQDVELSIINHISGISAPLPFFVGTNGNTIYFNGFYNYSFSLVFANLADGELMGTLHGYRGESTLTALLPLSNQQYALSQNNYGDGAILSQASVTESAIGFGGDLPVINYPEIDQNARVVIKEITSAGRSILLYGTHTRGRQLVFYAFDQASGQLISINYLGQTNPYTIGDFAETDDGGLAIVAETYIAGKFSRIALFKLSKQELADWF